LATVPSTIIEQIGFPEVFKAKKYSLGKGITTG